MYHHYQRPDLDMRSHLRYSDPHVYRRTELVPISEVYENEINYVNGHHDPQYCHVPNYRSYHHGEIQPISEHGYHHVEERPTEIQVIQPTTSIPPHGDLSNGPITGPPIYETYDIRGYHAMDPKVHYSGMYDNLSYSQPMRTYNEVPDVRMRSQSLDMTRMDTTDDMVDYKAPNRSMSFDMEDVSSLRSRNGIETTEVINPPNTTEVPRSRSNSLDMTNVPEIPIRSRSSSLDMSEYNCHNMMPSIRENNSNMPIIKTIQKKKWRKMNLELFYKMLEYEKDNPDVKQSDLEQIFNVNRSTYWRWKKKHSII